MKRVIITGASRGIGRVLALELARAGYETVLIASKSREALFQLKKEITDTCGVRCEAYLCDVGNPDDVKMVLSEAVQGGVYALVNNAAIAPIGIVTEMSPEEWRRVIDVNLNACFYTARIVVPEMLKKKEGRIVNISSVWGTVGASMETAYSASKGGVNAFTKALAKELGPSNIKVNAVAFGLINTEMNAHLSSEELAALVDEIPMDRMGHTDEAARLIRNILEAPDYLTGQVITMDGGWI